MDEIDYRLIQELQKDPRAANTVLAKTLGLSEATVRRHITELVSSKALALTAIPKASRFGCRTRAFIGLQVEVAHIEALAEQLSRYPELHYVSVVAGSIDILAFGFFRSTQHLSSFISNEVGSLPGILRMDTMVELRCLKLTLGRFQQRMPLR